MLNNTNDNTDSNSNIDKQECMLTTTDNPYNPFEQWDEWYEFDTSHGYHTCSYLARIAKFSDDLSDADQAAENERAIDEICFYNILGIYKKVTPESFKSKKEKK